MEPETVRADEILERGAGRRLGFVELPAAGEAGPLRIPIAVIAGRVSGPTVWINSALHGDEYLGPAVSSKLLAELDPSVVRGRLILTPTLNPGGVRAMHRSDPADGADMNRVWSQPPSAPARGAIVWAETELQTRSDAVVDLHSGGNRFMQYPFAVYPKENGPVGTESAELAKACGFPWIWAHRNSILKHALISAAAREGKRSVLLELAGEGKAEAAWVREMAVAVRGALAQLGVLEERPRFLRSYRVFESLEVVRNRQEGLWSRSAEPGTVLRAGDPLGRVLDLFGRERETVVSPRDAAVAGICTYGFVPAQDYVAEVAAGFHDEGAPQ